MTEDAQRTTRGSRPAGASQAGAPARGAARDGTTATRHAAPKKHPRSGNDRPGKSGNASGKNRAPGKDGRGERTYQRALAGRPITDLPPKAQEIIRAARRIVQRDGFDRLSFEAIAAEAGVYTSAIRYYFGSKSGLVEALVDVSTHDASLRVYERSRSESSRQMRVRRAVLESIDLTKPGVYQTTWEMLPHILRSKPLRSRVAKLYDVHRRHYDEVFAGADGELSPETVRCYASLLIAVLDGIAMQKALDPGGVDAAAIFALWADILTGSLAAGEADSPGPS